MFDELSIFRSSGALMAHAAERQGIAARNTANIDTPGYRMRELGTFDPAGTGDLALTTTRAGHLPPTDPTGAPTRETGARVTIEGMMAETAAASRQNNVATGVYRSAMNVLRASLGR